MRYWAWTLESTCDSFDSWLQISLVYLNFLSYVSYYNASSSYPDCSWCAKLQVVTVGTTSNRVEMCWRIVIKHKNKANKEENENIRFNEVRQFAYVLGAKGREFLLNQTIISYSIGGNTPLYIGMESLKKKETSNFKFGSETNSDTCSDSLRILLLSTTQGDCR